MDVNMGGCKYDLSNIYLIPSLGIDCPLDMSSPPSANICSAILYFSSLLRNYSLNLTN